MATFFDKSRAKLQNIFEDTYNYIKTVYNNANQVFTTASPFGQILQVLDNISQMILYYISRSVESTNIVTADRPQSIQGLAALTGYKRSSAQTATGLVKITPILSSSVVETTLLIPNFTKIFNSVNNLYYILYHNQEFMTISTTDTSSENVARIYQGTVETQSFTGTGYQLQSFEMNLKEGEWIVDEFVTVRVNSEVWTRVESLYDMSYREKAYVLRPGITSGIDLVFGTGSMGEIPELGAEITIEYIITDGNVGNIRETDLTGFLFDSIGYTSQKEEIDLNDYLEITPVSAISGGRPPENIELTKELATSNSRSMVLATTENYEAFFRKIQKFSRIKVWTEYDKYNPFVDNIIYCSLIPDLTKVMTKDEDYYSIPIELFTLSDYEKYNISRRIDLSGQKIFGTYIYFVNPEIANFAVNCSLQVKPGYNKTKVENNVRTAISNYFLTLDRASIVPKSDLIAAGESVEGVESITIDFVSEKVELLFGALIDKELYRLRPGEDVANAIGLQLTESEYDTLYHYLIVNDEDYGGLGGLELQQAMANDSRNLPVTQNYLEFIQTISQIDSINKFLADQFDVDGNILLKNDSVLPIFRGGFYDRFGNYYDTKISNRLGPLNITVN